MLMTTDYTSHMPGPTTPKSSSTPSSAKPKKPARKRAPKITAGMALANTAAAKAAAKRRKRDGLTPAEIEAIFFRFHEVEPEPKGELESINAYTLLVAVVLSAQATDVGVNKATRPLFQVVDTPEKMVALGEEGLVSYIKTIGLFRNKAKNVIALSRLLIERHGGAVPVDREALEQLPGVGRKTANVVLNMAFGIPTIAVDTHLFRVANRTGLAPGATPLAVELGLEKVVPDAYRLHAHHWLILHGRYVCKAAKPDCPRCIIADICRFEHKTPA
nr:endonuclease III [Phreatobacter oligotrophus]